MHLKGLRHLEYSHFSLLFEDSHAAVPHLQCQLLEKHLEVSQDHVPFDLEVHHSIDVVLALKHEELDVAPHVHRFQLEHQVLVLSQVHSNPVVTSIKDGNMLTAVFPVVVNILIGFQMSAQLQRLVRDQCALLIIKATAARRARVLSLMPSLLTTAFHRTDEGTGGVDKGAGARAHSLSDILDTLVYLICTEAS